MAGPKSSWFPESSGPLAVSEEGALVDEAADDERGEEDADGDEDGDEDRRPRREGLARLCGGQIGSTCHEVHRRKMRTNLAQGM